MPFFCLTMPIPFLFNQAAEDKHLIITRGCLTLCNAQATLHFRATFFGLLLPTTVSGWVSDIIIMLRLCCSEAVLGCWSPVWIHYSSTGGPGQKLSQYYWWLGIRMGPLHKEWTAGGIFEKLERKWNDCWAIIYNLQLNVLKNYGSLLHSTNEST